MGRWMWLVVGVLGLPLGVAAQQPALSCEQRLQEAQYKMNLAEMTQRYVRDTLTTELRQAVERAEKAEQAVQTSAPPKAPAPPPDAPPK